MITVEVFSSPGCSRCGQTIRLVHQMAGELGDDCFRISQVDVVEAMDRAVALGILATPSVVIDGRLVFTGQPAADALLTALRQSMDETGHR